MRGPRTMPLYLPRNGPRILFVHIPKTAGTSVTDYLTRRFGDAVLTNDQFLEKARERRGYVVPPGHLTADDLRAFAPMDVDLAFAVVRDPVERIVSEYRFQRQVKGLAQLGFATWLRVALAAAKREPRVYDNHIRPQTHFLSDTVKVFRLEDDLSRLHQHIDEMAGEETDNVFKRINPSSGTRSDVEPSRQDVALIADFYAEDYDKLGYPQPQLERYRNDPLAPLRSVIAGALAPILVAKQKRRWLL